MRPSSAAFTAACVRSEAFDEIDGGAGNDTNLSGSASNDELSGSSGADILRGNDGNDVLYGGNGADYISGGTATSLAQNELYGGPGADPNNAADDTDKVFADRVSDDDSVNDVLYECEIVN